MAVADPRVMLQQQLLQQGQARQAMQGSLGAWRGTMPQYRGTQNGQTPSPQALMPQYQGNRLGASLPIASMLQKMIPSLQPLAQTQVVDPYASPFSPSGLTGY